MERKKKWAVTGYLLWIIGLIVFIVGINLTGDVKEWMSLAGTIAFMAGLGITGALWVIRKKEEENDK